MPPYSLRLLALSLAISPTIALGATQNNTVFGTCPIQPTKTPKHTRPTGLAADAVYVEADHALLDAEGLSNLDGDVFIDDGSQVLNALQATYHNKTKQITGDGKVFLRTETLEVNSDSIDYNLDTHIGEALAAHYRLPVSGAHGKSSKILRKGKSLTEMQNASYTACPLGDNTWRINAKNLELDQEKQKGVARNFTLRIKEVPIFYFPYYSFPLGDKRQSGFLIPAFKNDTKSGFQVSLPYYFNLAPNYDWTLTPSILSKRGIAIGNEFRYLTEESEGTLVFNALPSDKLYNNKLRYQFNFNHSSRLGKGKLDIKAGGVSDDDYINDLEGSLAATSTVNIERKASYSLREKNWSFTALAQDFQVLDTNTDPYTRLPQLTLNTKPQALNQNPDLSITTETQYTHFYSNDQDNAHRLNFKVKASYNKTKSWGFFRPSLTLNHTEYRQGGTSDINASRTLPTVSIDTGLIFERDLGEKYKQTLEPRLFYTHTPYKDQSDLPLFDSAEKTLTFGRLFDENRFTGKDRIGDTNQITAAVTTRIRDKKTGKEKLRLSAGQVHYFQDRKVTLGDTGTVATTPKSELVLEASGEVAKNMTLIATTYIDTDEKETTKNSLKLRYKSPKRQILNLNYDYKRDDFRSAGVSFAAPINKRWAAAGSFNYDFENKRELESVLGVEYNSCCWKTRIAGRRYLLNDNETYDNAIFVELQLKGLGGFGSGATELLEDRISGFK